MGNKKTLIIDDDPAVTLGMHLRFRGKHYDTFFAAAAVSSLEEARKHPPDLIVLDLGLPASRHTQGTGPNRMMEHRDRHLRRC